MHNRGHHQHESDIDKVEENASQSGIEAIQVAPANTLTEEDTVMIVLLYTDVTVFAMIRVMVDFQLAHTAP